MSLSVAQVIKGRASFYHVTKIIKDPAVFQAKVVPFEVTQPTKQPAQLVIVKGFPVGKPIDQYNRERRTYALPSISKSPYIRKLLEVIGHDAGGPQKEHLGADTESEKIALTHLQESQPQSIVKAFRSTSPLPRTVARSVLKALVVFDSEDGVHADVNPNNIFVSGADGPLPVVKLGDLGVAVGVGSMPIRYQGLHIRAPEVWKNIGITSKADVWSLGVTVGLNLSLLVVDHIKRPSAMEALQHPWLQETTAENELD